MYQSILTAQVAESYEAVNKGMCAAYVDELCPSS